MAPTDHAVAGVKMNLVKVNSPDKAKNVTLGSFPVRFSVKISAEGSLFCMSAWIR